MAKFAPIHWKDFEKFLFFAGCEFVSQKASHRKYSRSDLLRPVIVTVSKKGMLPTRDIKCNLKTLKISIPEYLKILDQI